MWFYAQTKDGRKKGKEIKINYVGVVLFVVIIIVNENVRGKIL